MNLEDRLASVLTLLDEITDLDLRDPNNACRLCHQNIWVRGDLNPHAADCPIKRADDLAEKLESDLGRYRQLHRLDKGRRTAEALHKAAIANRHAQRMSHRQRRPEPAAKSTRAAAA